MAKLTQGTQIYFIDPDTDTATEVTCVLTFNPGGSPADQIETTCLTATEKTYKRGLRTPGQATFEINADPTSASHVRLHELFLDDTVEYLEWAVGWSDGTAAASTDSSGNYDLSTARTWYTFNAYVADFPFDFSVNSVVKTTVTLQRTGTATWTEKST